MVELRPLAAITDLNGWPINSVEVNVILAHELVEMNILGVEPPLLPILGIVGGDTGVSNWGIKLARVSAMAAE